jgi:hypothetical protein
VPRAKSRRGEGGSGSTGFSFNLSRALLATKRRSFPPIQNANGFRCWTTGEARTRGEFRAQAIWTSSRTNASGDASDGITDAGDLGGNTELEQILSGIVDDVMRTAAAASAAVMAEYAGKIAYAQKHLPRHQVAGAVRAFTQARDAALALIKRAAADDLVGRTRLATLRHRDRRRAVRRKHSPNGRRPPDGPSR